MNLPHLVNAVMCQPWCVLPSVHASIRQIIQSKLLSSDPPKRDPGTDMCGDTVESEQMTHDSGLAVIPINGVMARNVPGFQRGSGVCDVEDVMREIDWAANSNDISTILFNVDTPGGTVEGTPELAACIQQAAAMKGTYVYTAGMCCSAGIWACTKANALFAAPSATVGSIGVYMPWVDSSAYYARLGVKVDVISSGPFKGMGEPGTSLTPDQRALLQERVDGLASEFFDSVLISRRNFSADNMQGQVFTGKEACSIGLFDGNFNSLSDCIKALGFDSRAFVKKPQTATK